MFELFHKKVKPKVFYIEYTVKRTGSTYQILESGYSLEDIQEKIEEKDGQIMIKSNLYINLEELLNKYTTEKVSLDILKK